MSNWRKERAETSLGESDEDKVRSRRFHPSLESISDHIDKNLTQYTEESCYQSLVLRTLAKISSSLIWPFVL